ncbi:translation-associated GTPase [Pedobacter sp. BAL39]|nr:translation-associated GTPase [Pedobacter sp. BAL39]
MIINQTYLSSTLYFAILIEDQLLMSEAGNALSGTKTDHQ